MVEKKVTVSDASIHRCIGPPLIFERDEEAGVEGSRALTVPPVSFPGGCDRLTKSHCYVDFKFSSADTSPQWSATLLFSCCDVT